ncbi:MAG TPA: type 2 lanthipeptide synthetase LanM family protein [Ktedonobacteraceae bacterium]|nr:type 2 lanthipeptide synthetase LanM family protein [Ktedonobacteraceae bacterium]
MMKEVLLPTGTAAQTQQRSARWYQATTLTERVGLLQQNTLHLSTPEQASTEKAAQRLQNWKNQIPFRKSEQFFTQRLTLDGLSEEDLLALLAQPAEEIQMACATPPAWLTKLFAAFEQQDSATQTGLPLQYIDDPHTNAILQAFKPLLADGFARLQAGIAELQQAYASVPFDARTAGILLLPHFLTQWFNKPTKTLILELNVARLQGHLQGETPEQRFTYFLQQLAQPGYMLTLLEEYPVLARQMVEMVERWVTRSLELLQRLCADWEQIRALFSPETDPGILVEIKEGVGDPHAGERSVTILTWSSGLRLVYKPRPLAIDVHFQELLTWFNAQGCQPTFRTFKLLNRETHGWCEFIIPTSCESQEEIERFYQRLGGYLAVLYALEATDFHAENLIAAGEHPMLIDLESLFQPRAEIPRGIDGYGSYLFAYSVRRVGLLPQRQWGNDKAQGIDISGLVGQAGQLTPYEVTTWTGLGSDEMHATKGRVEIKLGNHQPTLQGQEIDPLAYESSIIAGFTRVYQLLLHKRDEILNTFLPRFAHDEIRMLARPTQLYTFIHADSSHPDALRDALDWDRLLDRLWIGAEQKTHLQKVIAAERADLQGNDIPKFTTYPASCDLYTSRGEVIPAFFQEPSLNLVKNALLRLDEQDLARQIWLIRASFASLGLNDPQTPWRDALDLRAASAYATREQFLEEAKTIGNRLHQLALVQDETISWLGMNLVGGTEWHPITLGPDLYNGISGVAFFMAYLGLVSGEEQYTSLARLITKTLQTIFLPKVQRWPWKYLGALEGLGSLIYLFSHLGTIWHDATFYQEADEITTLIPELIGSDEIFDVAAGSAGCIAALLSLYAVAPSPQTLALAVQCGEHLLKHARTMPRGIAWSINPDATPLAGMAHGNAGIALSLLRLAALSKEQRFHEAALSAMAYERSLFSQEKQNWPDLRPEVTAKGEKTSYMTAWCHGASGIGLARLASLPYVDDPAIRAEIDAALATTLAEGFGKNHALCHGDMGNLELLLLAAQSQPELYTREAEVKSLQAALLQNMRVQGWQSGVPRIPIETPGLMIGLAGTGYSLLRQADPERVPSVLVLASPMREHK